MQCWRGPWVPTRVAFFAVLALVARLSCHLWLAGVPSSLPALRRLRGYVRARGLHFDLLLFSALSPLFFLSLPYMQFVVGSVGCS